MSMRIWYCCIGIPTPPTQMVFDFYSPAVPELICLLLNALIYLLFSARYDEREMPWEVQKLHEESEKGRQGWLLQEMPVWVGYGDNDSRDGYGHHAQPVGQPEGGTLALAKLHLSCMLVGSHWNTYILHWKIEFTTTWLLLFQHTSWWHMQIGEKRRKMVPHWLL